MTTTDPQPLAEAMDSVIQTWHRRTGQTPPMAIFCAQSHPFDESTLCWRLDGHSGVHAADGKAWETTTDPKDNR